MPVAFVRGEAVALDAAIAEASRLLAHARLPVVAGLETDVAGMRAAVRLAERIGGVLDHAGSDASLCELNVMRTGGSMVISLAEARRICDLFLLIGPNVPELGAAATHVRLAGPSLADDLAILRAMAAGRPLHAQPSKLKTVLAKLQTARFGAAVWRSGSLAEPLAEMAMGLVRDLNANARFSTVILPGRAAGADQVLGWLTGFPARTSFARGKAEHDPWAFDARRLVESGETDLVVWISPDPPPWRRKVDTIAITSADRRLDAAVHLIGADHGGARFSEEIGSFVYRESAASINVPSIAAILDRLGCSP
jgi:formylmethanofuran dehydrogenase subunit B